MQRNYVFNKKLYFSHILFLNCRENITAYSFFGVVVRFLIATDTECQSINKSSAVAEIGHRLTLTTIDMGGKVGEGCCAPFSEREVGPQLTQCRLGRSMANRYLYL